METISAFAAVSLWSNEEDSLRNMLLSAQHTPSIPKVLVIEDERNVRMLLDLLLRQKGYEVLLAENGLTGMECYRREHPMSFFSI
jgi:response regulator RpfG family c-di-GMP phosphodiesterase